MYSEISLIVLTISENGDVRLTQTVFGIPLTQAVRHVYLLH